MSTPPPEEISLSAVIAVLHRQRYFIVGGTVLVAVLVAVASLFWPKTYEASAEILVSPPTFKKSMLLIPEPYSVVTYQKIAANPNLKMSVVDKVKAIRGGAMPEIALPPDQLEALRALDADWLNELGTVSIGDWMEVITYIEEETNLGVTYANIMTLVARAPNAGAAAAMANLWADAVLMRDATETARRATSGIASTVAGASRVEGLLRTIAERRRYTPILARGEDYLNRMETINAILYGRTEMQQNTNLESGQTTTQQSLADTGLLGEQAAAMKRSGTLDSEILRLSALVDAQMEGGRWIGAEAVLFGDRDQPATASRIADLEKGIEANAADVEVWSASVVSLRKDEAEALERATEEYVRAVRPLKEAGRDVSAAVEAATANRLANIHDDLMRARTTAEGKLRELRSEATETENALAAQKMRMEILNLLEMTRNAAPGQAAASTALEDLRRRFEAQQDRLTQARIELIQARAEAESLARRIQDMQDEKAALQPKVNEYIVERDNMLRKIALQEASLGSDETKARLAEADAEELLMTPNLQISSEAMTPNRRISPKRARMVLVGAAAAFIFFILLAFARDSWQRLGPAMAG